MADLYAQSLNSIFSEVKLRQLIRQVIEAETLEFCCRCPSVLSGFEGEKNSDN